VRFEVAVAIELPLTTDAVERFTLTESSTIAIYAEAEVY
jgi:hypothetical protein